MAKEPEMEREQRYRAAEGTAGLTWQIARAVFHTPSAAEPQPRLRLSLGALSPISRAASPEPPDLLLAESHLWREDSRE